MVAGSPGGSGDSLLGPNRRAYTLSFPAELAPEQVVAWLHALSGLLPGGAGRLFGCPPVVLEVWATADAGFCYRLIAPSPQADYVVGQMRTVVPGMRVSPAEAVSAQAWTRVVELGTRRMRRSLRVDPAPLTSSLLAGLQGFGLRSDEVVVLQWIIRPAVPERPPTQPSSRPVRLGPLLALPAPVVRDAVADQRAKLHAVNFLAVLRIGVRATSDARARRLLAGVRTAFMSVRTPDNALYVRMRSTSRLRRALDEARPPFLYPMQLTAGELSGLLAWPVGSPYVAGLPRSRSRHLPPSGAIARSGLVVARADFPGAERPLALSAADACKHLHVVGPTGVGKTALLGNLAAQAMVAGSGVIVIESKGDLFKLALESVPPSRLDDVIVVDVGDSRPVGFNLLNEGGSPRVVVEELCQLFEYLYPDMRRGVWARAALYRGLSTLITRPGLTFIDLVPLLSPSARSGSEQQWRDELIAGVTDPELARFWDRFDDLSWAQQENYAAPILDRVWQLNERREIRNIIGQSVSSFSLRKAIREGRILLVNLAGLGVETGRLAGSLLLNAVWSAVRGGAADPGRPTMLLLDEFQDFLNLPVDPETLLVRSRSYGLGMVLAHQHLEQLPSGLKSAVLANARSKVVFQTTSDDARVFAKEFGRSVAEDDFMNLGQYEVLCRLATRDGVSAPVSGVTLPPPEPTGVAVEVLTRSRSRYGRTPQDVEADIARRRTPREAKPVRRPRLGGTTWE